MDRCQWWSVSVVVFILVFSSLVPVGNSSEDEWKETWEALVDRLTELSVEERTALTTDILSIREKELHGCPKQGRTYAGSSSIRRACFAADMVLDSIDELTQGWKEAEMSALHDLYHSTGGVHWIDHTGWLQGDPCETSWKGVECEEGRISGIWLEANGLEGTIPESIGHLTGLMALSLSKNALHGPIPESIGRISALGFLLLDSNMLSGPLPSSLWELTRLRSLRLFQNEFTGPLSPAVQKLRELVFFRIEDNHLSGSVPSELGSLKKLMDLRLGGNHFTGKVPLTLGDLEHLAILHAEDNQLEGPIPSELGRIPNLLELILSNNSLTGSIPPSLCGMKKLNWLLLDRNKLTGTIPECVGTRLVSLQRLALDSNQLTGTLPPLNDLEHLEWLSASDNLLENPLPSTALLSKLVSVVVSGNRRMDERVVLPHTTYSSTYLVPNGASLSDTIGKEEFHFFHVDTEDITQLPLRFTIHTTGPAGALLPVCTMGTEESCGLAAFAREGRVPTERLFDATAAEDGATGMAVLEVHKRGKWYIGLLGSAETRVSYTLHAITGAVTQDEETNPKHLKEKILSLEQRVARLERMLRRDTSSPGPSSPRDEL